MREASESCKSCSSRAGSDNGNWRGGSTKHNKGYIMHRTDDGRYKMEHVLVMEEAIGRSLLPGENVHHINGLRDDNRLENLELWTRPQPSGIRASDAVAWAEEILRLYK